MKPLKLTMQAFGPYAGCEHIDFTKLGSRTMFVISGKTGSGKTTIFDGISYAIYGKASGEDRNGPDLRSQFAKDETVTEVSLEFTLRNKTYFITRSPQQEKKKARGDGFTTIGAKAELYVYDTDGNRQLLAANVRDVDEKVKEIMIIDSNQFRQILMIPQGEFRKLLTSESKDKEVILQRLFHTQIYKRIEEKLKEDAVELRKMVEKQVEHRNQAIQNIHVLYNEELKGYQAAGSLNDHLIMPLLQTEISKMSEELEKLADYLKIKQEERNALQQKLYEAEAIAKQLKAKDDLQSRKEELEKEIEKYSHIEVQINLAQKAAVLAQQEELCHHLKKEVDAANRELSILKEEISHLTIQLKEQEEKWEAEKERELERTAIGEQISYLNNLKSDIQSFASVQKEVQELGRELENCSREKSALEEMEKRIDKNILALKEEKQEIDHNQLKLVEVSHKLEKLAGEISLIIKFEDQKFRLEQATSQFEKKKKFLANAVARLADAKSMTLELEQKWLHGQASLLANKLQDGEACPVCGSEHHPKIVTTAAEIPNEKDIKMAKQQYDEIEKEKGSAEKAFYEVQSIILSLKETVNNSIEDIQRQQPDLSPADFPVYKHTIMSKRQELEATHLLLTKSVERLSIWAKELQTFEQDKEKNDSELQKKNEQLNETTILYTEKKTYLKRMMESIPEDLRTIDAFEARLMESVKKQNELMHRLESAQRLYQDSREKLLLVKTKYETIEMNTKQTNEQLVKERAAFVDRMKEQGFAAYGEYNGAKKSDQEIKLLEKAFIEYREEVRSVNDRYNELHELLAKIEKPDMDKLNAAFTNIDVQIRSLQEAYTNLFMKKRDNEELESKINQINEKMKALEEKYKVIGHLSEIAKGQNTYRITFERFVLASFLDDILNEANGRLRKMTSGRYELIRKTDRSKGNVQSGLELLVFDQYTGQERHVKTLSGGESFKAALALALGLADVVQQYAGGVSLETMFIDEGFGTLDPESLDQAVEALIDIQSSGRLVGIISHVPELKERIDVRLEVVAAQTGSRTEFQFLT
ncbi:AAA family ATPase [Cytobacillus solani]|uniref:Nuclease SbcCD subunit C n=1 Tax=Cytobacillus solani TaxID=1637975 RepID=A0A0Q3SIC4_9BACI|nr:AAA family ATPase [Cytobacillus solani]KQL19292.1 ATP-dependent dsDNA exonuclease [Cytobacillus solani]